MIKRIAREGFLSLWAAKQRTALAVLGISIGIASVISMVTVGKIVERETLEQFKSLGTDFFAVSFPDAKKLGPLTPARAREFTAGLPSVSGLATYVAYSASVVAGRKRASPQLLGADESFEAINRLRLAAGRFVHSLDRTASFCVLGAGVARDLDLDPTGAVGKTIRLAGTNFEIIGVLKSQPGGGIAPFSVDGSVMIPFAKARRMFPAAPPNVLVGRIKPGADARAVPAEIAGYFQRHQRGALPQVNTAEQLIAQMEKQTRIFTLLLGAIGGISLIVGGVGVMNVMLVAVTERRTEIGLRRAIGAERRHVQQQFVIESVLLCLVGGVVGVAGGLGAAWGIAQFSHWHYLVHLPAIAIGVGVSCLIGIFFGFYPAYQASQLKIITALRA